MIIHTPKRPRRAGTHSATRLARLLAAPAMAAVMAALAVAAPAGGGDSNRRSDIHIGNFHEGMRIERDPGSGDIIMQSCPKPRPEPEDEADNASKNSQNISPEIHIHTRPQ